MSLDPVLQQLLAQVPVLSPGPIDYPAVRRQFAATLPMIAPPSTLVSVESIEDLTIDNGGTRVPARIYRPHGEVSGIVHFIHGGGWSIGDLNKADPTARRLCDGLSMVVIASTYRLSPENPFPAGYEDSLAVARWVQTKRAELGGLKLPTVIVGDSAGGNLAAAITLAMRDVGEPSFDVQLLLYPVLDLRAEAAAYPSRQRNADPSLRSDLMSQYVGAYVGDADLSDQRISPLAAASVANLPPALLVVQSVDPLRDEAVAYAERLRHAGVRTEVLEFDNLTHGFVDLAAIVPAAREATEQVLQRLRTLVAGQA